MSVNRKRAAVICISAPSPPSTGTRLRCQSVIRSLIDQKYDVTVIYPRDTSESDEEIAIKLGLTKAISLPGNFPLTIFLKKVIAYFFKHMISEVPYSRINLSFRAKYLLRKLKKNPPFDLLITEYSIATPIRHYLRSKHYILDTCDLMSIHYHKVSASKKALSRWREMEDPAFLKIQFFDSFDSVITKDEISDFKQYDALIAISESEHQQINQLQLSSHHYLIPPCVSVPDFTKTDYSGFPVFAYSSNIFNTQGLIHFINVLLPRIIEKIPDFRLIVTGNPPSEASNCSYLICVGFVEKIQDIYENAGFSIIPAYGGTGQQLKVAEAMSHSLAVVGYRKRIDESIFSDGLEGYLADNEEEFVSAVTKLWSDRYTSEIMGRKALAKVQMNLSQKSFNMAFEKVTGNLESQIHL